MDRFGEALLLLPKSIPCRFILFAMMKSKTQPLCWNP